MSPVVAFVGNAYFLQNLHFSEAIFQYFWLHDLGHGFLILMLLKNVTYLIINIVYSLTFILLQEV